MGAAGRPREGAGPAGGTDGYGKLVTVLGVVLVSVTAPVVLITWPIEPTLPSETVSRSCHAIPDPVGDWKAMAELTAGLTLK